LAPHPADVECTLSAKRRTTTSSTRVEHLLGRTDSRATFTCRATSDNNDILSGDTADHPFARSCQPDTDTDARAYNRLTSRSPTTPTLPHGANGDRAEGDDTSRERPTLATSARRHLR
jgi:hypothetical protein